jgi:hypothetical protein
MLSDRALRDWEEKWLDPDYDFNARRDDEWEFNRADEEYAERGLNDGE